MPTVIGMTGKNRARRRLRPRTWIVIGAIALVVIAAAVTVPLVLTHLRSGTAEARTVTATVATQTLQKSVSGTGTLTPTVNEDVAFAVSGKVTEVDVTAGQTVAAGDVLARVDPVSLNAQLLSAQADLAQAQATLADAKSASTGSSADKARIAADEAQVSVRQAAVVTAQAAVANATLTAPVAGVVTVADVAVGDTVGGASGSGGSAAGSGSDSSSTGAFTIVGTGAWMTTVNLSESDVALIKAGDQVELTMTGSTEQLFGVVRSIGLLPSTTSGSAEYPVVIDLTGTDQATGLHDGVSATATIIYERRTDVLAVPAAAVTTSTDGTATVRVQAADGTVTDTAVTVGESDGTYTEITAGVTAGDTIVLASFTPGTGNGTGTGTRTGGTGGFGGFTGTGTGTGTGGFEPPAGVQLQPATGGN